MRDVRLSTLTVLVALAATPAVAADPWRLGSTLEAPAATAGDQSASLSFTPRLPGVFDLDSARVTLSYTPMVEPIDAPPGRAGALEGFSVGGALAIDRFVVEGAVARTSSGLVERERLDAAIGFGGFTTRMHVQDTEAVGSASGSTRYGIGADVTAAPGLSLGAGLDFSERADGLDDEAAGVVRFRLEF